VFKEQLPSGRWRAGFRLGGHKITQTWDYEYEAVAWALEAEAAATAAAASVHQASPQPTHQPTHQPSRQLALAPAVVAPSGPTIAEHAQDWLARRKGGLEPQTHYNYVSLVNAINASNLAAIRVDAVRYADVQTWLTQAQESGAGRPIINRRLKAIKMILDDAVANHLADANPARAMKGLMTDDGPDRTFDRDEEARIMAVAATLATPIPSPTPGFLVLPILLGLDAGLRWQEAYALTAGAVRLAEGYLTVSEAVSRSGGGAGTRIKHTKGGRWRVVPIATDRLAEALAEAVEETKAARGRDGLLRPNRLGTVMKYATHRERLWVPTMVAAGIDSPPGFHGLRHTYGSRLAAAGVPRSEIAKLMGHADESTTARYVHTGDDGRRATLARAALAVA
jgi:integrase